MKKPALRNAGVAATILLTLLSWADLALARPKSEERVPTHMRWSNQRGKKLARTVVQNMLEGRSHDKSKATTCNTSEANIISAPHDNVWVGLSDQEAVSVVSWLFGQESLNLTAAEDAGEWDNTV